MLSWPGIFAPATLDNNLLQACILVVVISDNFPCVNTGRGVVSWRLVWSLRCVHTGKGAADDQPDPGNVLLSVDTLHVSPIYRAGSGRPGRVAMVDSNDPARLLQFHRQQLGRIKFKIDRGRVNVAQRDSLYNIPALLVIHSPQQHSASLDLLALVSVQQDRFPRGCVEYNPCHLSLFHSLFFTLILVMLANHLDSNRQGDHQWYVSILSDIHAITIFKERNFLANGCQ